MKKYRVTFTAVFTAEVEVDENDDSAQTIKDAILDIDIPEGGENSVCYKPGSFDMIAVEDAQTRQDITDDLN